MERDKGMEEKGPVEGVADEIYEVGRDCVGEEKETPLCTGVPFYQGYYAK